ncbi:MAG: prepilin-type N-terminal cleavage/methylation domain-containing protein [Elainellaceae cyanobacterium]
MKPDPNPESGFTLFELLIVVVIIAVLAAIAAPGWGALANRQKANRARTQILQALRQTQSEARRLRSDRSIVFDTDNNTLDYPGDGAAGAVLLTQGDVGADIFVFTAENQAGDPVPEIWFSANGGLDLDRGIAADDLPLYLTVTPRNSTAARCVIVRSLIGGIDFGRSAADCGG